MRAGREEGSAVVEFLALVVLLLVPVLYLVATLGRLQAASFAVEGAARDGARLVARAPDLAEARQRAALTTRIALQDQGLDPAAATTRVHCPAAGCNIPQTVVRVDVATRVPLPLVPAFAGGNVSVDVTATHTMTVDRHARLLPADPA